MCRLSIASVVIIFLISSLQSSNGYKWIPLKSGAAIPENAVKLHDNPLIDTYVGRARHYNLILPAEVTQQGATIYNLGQVFRKTEYEVLVATENCQWPEYTDKVENAVRAGTAWNGEPIFVGKAGFRIASVFLTSGKDEDEDQKGTRKILLICDDTNKWVDSSFGNLPKNAVSFSCYFNKFVARVLGPSSFVVGSVADQENAVANYKGHWISSAHYQVLVGDLDEYSWVLANFGEKLSWGDSPLADIPDYAVVVGHTKSRGLLYVAKNRGNSDCYLESVAFSDAVHKNLWLLVKNVK